MNTTERIRFKFSSNYPLKYGANAAAEFDNTDWPRFVRITDITPNGKLREETFRSLPPEIARGYELEEGDILLARSGATVGKTFIYEQSWGEACYAGYLIRSRTSELYWPKFIYWYFQSNEYWSEIQSNLIQATIQNFSAEKYANIKIPFLPLETQKRIAAFLDEKTARIDALIAKKQALLERLAEKRQAIITQAVTKGLNPAAPMKDSGIDWLGQIPAHWEVIRIKFATSHVVDCLHTTPTYDGDLLYPAIRTADVDRGTLRLDQARLVSQQIYDERIQRLKPIEGDILYSREGERFGMAALVPPNINICLGQRMMMFRVTHEFNPAYVMWALNSDFIYQQVISEAGGSTSPHVNISNVINFWMPNPPMNDQCEIAAFVERQRKHIEAISAEVMSSIAKLAEYRSALVTAAVTGQIEELR